MKNISSIHFTLIVAAVLMFTFTISEFLYAESSSRNFATEYEGNPVLLIDGPLDETRAYRSYAKGPRSEISKMNYLIALVAETDKTIIRNGTRLNGEWAAKGFRFKFKKHADERGKTARDFIENICTFSKKTGQKYILVLSDGSHALMNTAFHHELDRLDVFESKFKNDLDL